MDEFGWVIERKDDPMKLGHHYFSVVCGHACWSTIEWCVRFSRKTDAQRMADAMTVLHPELFEGERVEYNEHSWYKGKHPLMESSFG